jgi:hypothetical protein
MCRMTRRLVRPVALALLTGVGAAFAQDAPVSVSSLDVGSHPVGIEAVGLGSRATIVLVLRATDCPECARALDVYKRVGDACAAAADSSVRIVVLSMDPPADMIAALKERRVRVHGVFSFPRRQTLRVTALPTAFVMDKAGTITGSWAGEPDARQESALMAACAAR